MSDKNITIGNETRLMTSQEETEWSENVAKINEKDNAEATAQAEAQAAKETDQANGNQKLLDLGLTQAESTALTGYTPPSED
jgi:hypothetical protein